MKKIRIGRITGAQGLRGEVKMFHDSGEDEALSRLTSLFLCKNGESVSYKIKGIRMQRRTPVIKLEGIDDRDSAESLTGSDVYSDEDESRPDEENAWLANELEGMEVFLLDNEDSGIGHVKSVISNPAHDILEIQTKNGLFMLPFIDVFVREADIIKGRMTIQPPDGWLE